ncbi:Hypothetical predicted protein [Pelobates cultripes]|uniref:Uncharacterized protein n=1 Tax=Pelobates cultripes TaxID=61616 RepID=A0AAD1RP78_PELCU|nr:Hypothetical predicted protein [Pelobates cultripes]
MGIAQAVSRVDGRCPTILPSSVMPEAQGYVELALFPPLWTSEGDPGLQPVAPICAKTPADQRSLLTRLHTSGLPARAGWKSADAC